MSKMTQEQIEKMRAGREEARKEHILLFECDDYTIEKIKLNYRIMIKCAKRNQNQAIERDWYSMEEFGVEEAHNIAKQAITDFFKKGVKPINPFA